MDPATYVAEYGLAGHHWEERPLFLGRLDTPVYRNSRLERQVWMVCCGSTLIEARRGRIGQRVSGEGPGKGITFEM